MPRSTVDAGCGTAPMTAAARRASRMRTTHDRTCSRSRAGAFPGPPALPALPAPPARSALPALPRRTRLAERSRTNRVRDSAVRRAGLGACHCPAPRGVVAPRRGERTRAVLGRRRIQDDAHLLIALQGEVRHAPDVVAVLHGFNADHAR